VGEVIPLAGVIDVGVNDPAFARMQLAATTGEIVLTSDSLEIAGR
jgi:hypothetical protein